MMVLEEPEDFRGFLEQARAKGKRVGFHPTMGALHGGHLSNIRRAAAECDVAAISIYVNPLQFGPGEDFSSYPRDFDADLEKASKAGAHVLFAPKAMYSGEASVTVRPRYLDEVLEGLWRPGHFEGVATIVTKLLALVGPCSAYFGEKDYQQLLVVRRVVSELCLPAEVVACPTVREPDGLALSSRNAYLSAEERAAAPALYWSLLAGKRAVEEQGVTSAELVKSAMLEAASREPLLRLDYVAVADPVSLEPSEELGHEVRLLIAGSIGKTRLIDNVKASAGKD